MQSDYITFTPLYLQHVVLTVWCSIVLFLRQTPSTNTLNNSSVCEFYHIDEAVFYKNTNLMLVKCFDYLNEEH